MKSNSPFIWNLILCIQTYKFLRLCTMLMILNFNIKIEKKFNFLNDWVSIRIIILPFLCVFLNSLKAALTFASSLIEVSRGEKMSWMIEVFWGKKISSFLGSGVVVVSSLGSGVVVVSSITLGVVTASSTAVEKSEIK